MEIRLEFAPSYIEDQRLTPFERHILAALHQLHQQSEDNMSKTQDAIAALVAADTELASEVSAVLGNVTDLEAEVAKLQAAIAAPPADDPSDTTNADAIAAATANITALTASIKSVLTPPATADTTQATGTADDTIAADAGTDSVTETTQAAGAGDDTIAAGAGNDTVDTGAVAVTFSPNAIVATLAQPASGTFAASDGQVYTYASDDAVAGVTISPDGFYATSASQAISGVVNVTATAPDGTVLPPFPVSVSITDA